MNNFIPKDTVNACRERQVSLGAEVQIGFPNPGEIIMESPSSLGRGVYDVDLSEPFLTLEVAKSSSGMWRPSVVSVRSQAM